jgi:excisionase family DNA binding protein
MKIYKITEASEYLGVSINTLKTLANNKKIKSFKTSGSHRRFRQDDLDAYMGVEKEKQEKLTVIYARCSRQGVDYLAIGSKARVYSRCGYSIRDGTTSRVCA